jgi:hypothetical protein
VTVAQVILGLLAVLSFGLAAAGVGARINFVAAGFGLVTLAWLQPHLDVLF